MEDQPLPDDASPVALSPGYIADSDPEEDEKDPNKDPADYPADGGDDYDESSDDDNDDDYDVEEDEVEELLAPADSTVVASPAVDPVPFAKETEPFESDESTATPPPPPAYHTTARMSIRSQAPIPCPSEAEIPSPPLPIPLPPTTSPTYTEVHLGYRTTRIWLRAASPLPLSAPSTSCGADIPEADISPQKRLLLTAPTPRFDVGESSAATRQPGSTVASRVDYSFVDTVDANIRASERRTMAAIEMVNLRVDTLRRYLSSICTTHEQERVKAHQALARSEAHNRAFEVLEARARIDTLEDTGSSKMPPRKGTRTRTTPATATSTATTTTLMTDAAIRALIAQGVADALVE
ncbi:hypothetical protein Tco_0553446 [Tanacetum coccineum]